MLVPAHASGALRAGVAAAAFLTAVPVHAQGLTGAPASPSPRVPSAALASRLGPDFHPYSFSSMALQTSALLRADAICPEASTICPLGSGGGIYVVFLGRRYRPHLEWALGYDASVRNARNFFSSATLQALRFDYRYIVFSSPRSNLEAHVGVSGAIAVYGESFFREFLTFGPIVGGIVGANYYLSPFLTLGIMGRVDALRFVVPFDSPGGVRHSSDEGFVSVTASALVSLSFLGR